MDAPATKRTPLHAMSDLQLLWIATDDLIPHTRREFAQQLLDERYEALDFEVPADLVARIQQYTGQPVA
jgi:hypothetical protein